MKAAYLLDNKMHVGDVAEPIPGEGQVLVRTRSCGICASDSHWLHHAQDIVDYSRENGWIYGNVNLTRPIVPGHEFNGEIVGFGPGTSRRLKPGTIVTSKPLIKPVWGGDVVGHSNNYPGGFGEYMVLEEDFLLEIPSGIDTDLAAMAEPLAVGLRHARTGQATKQDVCVVIGCGAIGLAVIAGLRLLGAGPIIAADLAASRRETALKMGADIIVDPRQESPYLPQSALNGRRGNIIFECVGKPGVLDDIFRKAAPDSRVVVAGFCWENDQVFTPGANVKRLTVIFGSRSKEDDMGIAVRSICDDKVDVSSWVGARVGLSGVAAALGKMGNPEAPIRTVIHPAII
jgi:threonine dehydrogenase-like Zn-dependent dehydrogenase